MKENSKIRLLVLNKSLEVEHLLSTILIQLFRIPKSDSKTLSNKSSALSFRTKVDLLYDLDRINKEQYTLLILFMEIRNQFIHNIEATSFEKVIEILDISKKNKFLKLDPDILKNYQKANKLNDDRIKPETVLILAFDKLKLDIDAILLEVVERLMADLEEEDEQKNEAKMNKISEKIIDIITKIIDDFGETYEKQLKDIMGKDTGFDKVLNHYVNTNLEKQINEHFSKLYDNSKNAS